MSSTSNGWQLGMNSILLGLSKKILFFFYIKKGRKEERNNAYFVQIWLLKKLENIKNFAV